MQRYFTLLLAVVVVSCEHERQDPTAPLTGSPQAAISDGANGGNLHFYWLPELVVSPSPTGTFNGSLPAEIRLCRLNGRGTDGTGSDASCVPSTETVLFAPSQISVDLVAEQYSAVWKTGDSNLDNAEDYRLSVFVGATELGYRDLDPEENPPSPIDKTAPFYAFKNGNAINIKFRVEEGALCDPDSESCGECLLQPDGTGGNNPDFFENGDESACNADVGVGVFVPEEALTEPTLIVVERVSCGPVQEDGRVNFFQSLDIPQYGGCFKVRADPPLNIEAPANYSIVGVCVDSNSLSPAQAQNLTLHKTADATDPNGEVVALNNVSAPFIDCDAFLADARDANSPALLRLARRAWRKFSPFQAKSLYATHKGDGGEVPTFSHFVWGLSSQQEALSPLSQVAPTGSTVTAPAVKVTDEDDLPVKGAKVTFTLVQSPGTGGFIDPSSAAVVETDELGIAALDRWQLGSDPGDNIVTSGGYGIAVKGEEWTSVVGTRVGTGPFVHSSLTDWDGFDDVTVEGFRLPLELNPSGNPDFNLEFTATGCVQGEGTADVTDGVKDASWDCANTEPFTANIGGGKKDATFYWMREGSTFFFAIQIPVDETSSESVNIWTLYLNDTGSSQLTEGDDVLVLDGASQVFGDQHWGEGNCPRGQSFCAFMDDAGKRNGEGHFAINQNPDGSAFYFYELKHELQGDDYQDVADSGMLGGGFTLRVGNGNKGNTEWPGPFGAYTQIIP